MDLTDETTEENSKQCRNNGNTDLTVGGTTTTSGTISVCIVSASDSSHSDTNGMAPTPSPERSLGTTVSDRTKSLILQKISLNTPPNVLPTTVKNDIIHILTKEEVKQLELQQERNRQLMVVEKVQPAESEPSLSSDRSSGLTTISSEMNTQRQLAISSDHGMGTQPSVMLSVPIVHMSTSASNQTAANSRGLHSPMTKVQGAGIVAGDKQATQGTMYRCDECDYYSTNKHYLKQHVDLVHSADRPYKCPFCDYAGKRSHALREHLIVHSSERPFECVHCNATFRKKGHLTNHVKLHTSQRLHKCPLCKELVTERGASGFDAHLKDVHHTEQLYGCDLCDFIAASEPDILEHLRKEHISGNLIKCKMCHFTTLDVASFEKHLKSHTPVLTTKSMADTSTTSTSTRKQPTVIKPVWIKCSECGFTGQDSEVIKQHMLKHIGEVNAKVAMKSKPISPQCDPSMNLESFALQTERYHQLPQKSVRSEDILQEKTFANLVTISSSAVPTGAVSKEQAPLSNTEPFSSTSRIDLQQTHPMIISSSESPQKDSKVQTVVTLPDCHPFSAASSKAQNANTQLSTGNTAVQPQIIKIPTEQFEHHLKEACNSFQKEKSPGNRNPINISLTDKPIDINVPPSSQPESSSTALSVPDMEADVLFKLKDIPVPNLSHVSTSPPKLPVQLVKSNVKKEKAEQEQLELLRKRLANVQELIQQQEKLQRQTGDSKVKYLDSKGIPQTADMKNIVYYITPVSKQNTVKNPTSVGFTHDSTAGRFRCTICGYTCEYQRTIKAHIWKHSGHKNIDYPMFQNGPLSIYEDTPLVKEEQKVHVIDKPQKPEIAVQRLEKTSLASLDVKEQGLLQADNKPTGAGKPDSSPSLPPFIVYEQSKISNVAPALAHLLAARTMVGLRDDGPEKVDEGVDVVTEISATSADSNCSIGETEITKGVTNMNAECTHTTDEPGHDGGGQTANVVVEAVDSLVNESRYTAMVSQQNSPRLVGRKSPDQELSDSGVSSELTSTVAESMSNARESKTETVDSHPVADLDLDSMELGAEGCLVIDAKDAREDKQRNVRRSRRVRSLEASEMDRSCAPANKKHKSSGQSEESAVTLLSLLKKGPNFNPACPPSKETLERYSAPASPGQEDVSLSSGIGGSKPKSGISSSLLAVIEQLRERSKSDLEEEKQYVQAQASKKQPKRKSSRRSSVEERVTAVDIDIENVEQFETEGETKYRCKLCHYKNESTALLRQHMRLHKTKQPFECSLCDFLAESSEALQDHMIQHCKVRTYQCKMCTSAFNYKSQLRAHMRAHNDQEVQVCDYEAQSPPCSKNSAKGRGESKSFKCGLCKEEFITNFNLRIHKREGCRNQNTDAIGSYSCTVCEYVTQGLKEMKMHQKIHSKDIIPYFRKCYQCEFTSPSATELRQHLIEEHSGVQKPLKCEKCGFTAVSVRSLKSHMKRHVNDQRFVQQPLEQYKCNLCGYVCHHLPSLKSHMWRHATDEQYSYEFTNEVINAAIDFDCHTEAQDTSHEDVEEFHKLIRDKMKTRGLATGTDVSDKTMYACCWVVFRCCQCGFETINKAELNVHMKSHSDVIKWTLEVPANKGPQVTSHKVGQLLEGSA